MSTHLGITLGSYGGDVNEFPKDGTLILCPVCGDTYVHQSNVEQLPGFDDYRASKHVRGDVNRIAMYCENGGHHFYLNLGFHKGSTHVWCEQIPHEDEGDDEQGYYEGLAEAEEEERRLQQNEGPFKRERFSLPR